MPSHPFITSTLRVMLARHERLQVVPFTQSGFYVLLALLTVFLASVYALSYFTTRPRHSKDSLNEANTIAWAMLRPVIVRLGRNERVQQGLAHELKALAQSQSDAIMALQDQQAESERLANYVGQALRNNAKLADHLAALKTSLKENRGLPELKASAPLPGEPDALTFAVADGSIVARLTPTELEVLRVLELEGGLPAPEVGRRIKKSREHTARLMKTLFEQGYVERESGRIPFRYRLTDRVRNAYESAKRRGTVTQRDRAPAQT